MCSLFAVSVAAVVLIIVKDGAPESKGAPSAESNSPNSPAPKKAGPEFTGMFNGTNPVPTSSEMGGNPTGSVNPERDIIGDAGVTRTVVRIRQTVGKQHEVDLPERDSKPVWVPTSRVDTYQQSSRLIVDVKARTAKYETPNGVSWVGDVAVGKPSAQTPLGSTWVTEKVLMPDPEGPYGLWAWGLGMWSESLTEFGDGNAQVAVHGTNRPESLGQDASSGCIRISNSDLTLLEMSGFGIGSIVETR